MEPITLLGLAAGTLTTAAFVPQVLKVWRTRSARDISILTFVALLVGTALWLAYGIFAGDLPLVAANSIALFLIGAVLVAKVRFG